MCPITANFRIDDLHLLPMPWVKSHTYEMIQLLMDIDTFSRWSHPSKYNEIMKSFGQY